MKRILALTMALLSVLFLFGCGGNEYNDSKILPNEMPEDFSFTIVWGVFGRSSYDSKTGKLVKTTDATNPDEYITTYNLSNYELKCIYNLLCELHMEQYPNEFDNNDFIMSDPYCKYSLSVNGGGFSKTITANQVGLSSIEDVGKTKKAKNYLEVIDEIVEILTGTDEWKALPDYEFLYD